MIDKLRDPGAELAERPMEAAEAYYARIHANVVEALRDLAPALQEWEAAKQAARGALPSLDLVITVAYVREIAAQVRSLTQAVEAYPKARAEQLAGWARDTRKSQAYIDREEARRKRWEQERADEEAGFKVRMERHEREAADRQRWEEENQGKGDALTGWE